MGFVYSLTAAIAFAITAVAIRSVNFWVAPQRAERKLQRHRHLLEIARCVDVEPFRLADVEREQRRGDAVEDGRAFVAAVRHLDRAVGKTFDLGNVGERGQICARFADALCHRDELVVELAVRSEHDDVGALGEQRQRSVHEVGGRVGAVEDVAALGQFERALVARAQHRAAREDDEVVALVQFLRDGGDVVVESQHGRDLGDDLVDAHVDLFADALGQQIERDDLGDVGLGRCDRLLFVDVEEEVDVAALCDGAVLVVGDADRQRAARLSVFHDRDGVLGHAALADDDHAGRGQVDVRAVDRRQRRMILAHEFARIERTNEREDRRRIVGRTSRHRDDLGDIALRELFADLALHCAARLGGALEHLGPSMICSGKYMFPTPILYPKAKTNARKSRLLQPKQKEKMFLS